MSKPVVTVVDAVMGTGKSTWVMQHIKALNRRTIIVVPRKTELLRYQEGLKDLDGVVALVDSDEDKRAKKERFVEALSDTQIIITTHQLFEDCLTMETFDTIKEGEWWLVLDEIPTVFNPVKLVSGTVIDGYVSRGLVEEVEINETVSKLTVNPLTYKGYCDLPTSEATASEKRMLKEATVKDVLIVRKEDATRGFPTFSLREERLDVFQGVTVLTYPFKGSDLDYWLQIKGYTVEHLELVRDGMTGSLDDFELQGHCGKYSGKQYQGLIEFVEDNQRGRGRPYGTMPNHFSCNEMGKMVDSGRSTKRAEKLEGTKKTLRREFRNRSHKARWANSEVFMFTCLKSVVSLWADRQKDLPADFIGERNHVPFNTIGTNDYSHKTHLAFLHNVYQFPEIEKLVQAFGLEYDHKQYALYTIIQWIWRSAIRRGEKIHLYVPSRRMRTILEDWLCAE